MEMFLKHSNNPEKSPHPDLQALKNLNPSVDHSAHILWYMSGINNLTFEILFR